MSKQVQTIYQKQSLSLTAGMHQSISILQMSSVELSELARSELDKNPFLEDTNISVEQNIEQKGNESDNSENICFDTTNSYNNNNDLSSLGKRDDLGNFITNENCYNSSNNERLNFTSYQHGSSSSQDYIENISEKKTLKTHILEQINLNFEDNKEILIAYYLLDYLKPNGYLSVNLQEVAENLKCHIELVQHVLKKLQKFDPPGIFARNLKECLKIQLQETNSLDTSLLSIINNLDLLASGDLKKLSKVTQINLDNLSDIIKQIKLLNPKPGNGFLEEDTSFKIPDVILSFDIDGNPYLEINDDSLPKVKVNTGYYENIKDSLTNTKDKDFSRKELELATILVKSIQQRGNTILKISKSIIEEQIDFFKRGIMYLKPMTLNHIAAKTGFNESTVSRSTSNKYISTPSGIYELKYFFSSTLNSTRASSQGVSSTKVKELIKQIVMSEEAGEAFSDDEISKQLKSFSIEIARRTISKYRDELKIPPASKRKRAKEIL